MFRAWPKIPRLENEIYHISEKIDGTNAAIVIVPYDNFGTARPIYTDYKLAVYAQSRTRLITPEDDNYGFAKWVQANAEQLIKDLGEGYHFGEWWGKGIQRGYDLEEKRFSLFNPTKHSTVCHNVPLVRSLTAEEYENLDWLEGTKQLFVEFGSLASPGYMKPEGFIIYAEKAKSYWKVIMDK